jgi:hypothetical protein
MLWAHCAGSVMASKFGKPVAHAYVIMYAPSVDAPAYPLICAFLLDQYVQASG